jgi:hypothetical protein
MPQLLQTKILFAEASAVRRIDIVDVIPREAVVRQVFPLGAWLQSFVLTEYSPVMYCDPEEPMTFVTAQTIP